MSDTSAPNILEGVPQYTPRMVDVVAKAVNIRAIELIHSHFAVGDDGPFRASSAQGIPFEVGVRAEWKVSSDRSQLGCILSFATLFPNDEGPYEVLASFRLLYAVQPNKDVSDQAIEQFIWWDSVFTAWPYWREHLASHVSRAGFDSTPLSSLPLPRSG